MEHGRLLKERLVSSRCLGANRTVRIYLPPSYAGKTRRRYPVLYLHDGQNVFSSVGPDGCFGWGGWELDKTVDALGASGQMREIIMVAIDNSSARYQEYCSLACLGTERSPSSGSRKTSVAGRESRFPEYAAFLRRELKPQIDREFRTLPGPAHTGVLGSSFGGICSLALAWLHPRTFGLAACVSGSFQIERRYFLEKVLRRYRGQRKSLKIYLDSGIIDFPGDDDGRLNTEAVAAELRRIGWRDEVHLRHFVDEPLPREAELERLGLPRHKWAEARRSQHNEFYWRHRVWRALVFLFPPFLASRQVPIRRARRARPAKRRAGKPFRGPRSDP